MTLEMFFDLMFDPINEADGIPVQEIETDSERKVYVVELEDGSRFEVECKEEILRVQTKSMLSKCRLYDKIGTSGNTTETIANT